MEVEAADYIDKMSTLTFDSTLLEMPDEMILKIFRFLNMKGVDLLKTQMIYKRDEFPELYLRNHPQMTSPQRGRVGGPQKGDER